MEDHPGSVSAAEQPKQDRLRLVPSVDVVLRRPQVALLIETHGRPVVTQAVRAAIMQARGKAAAGGDAEVTPAAVASQIQTLTPPRLTSVLNATGVVLHTNLGRAPLAPAAIAAMGQVAQGYSNLEYDLETGTRGSRYGHAAPLLRQLLDCEDALVVNNGAAAVLLALSALAAGREAVVSRGELVEIGGGFRVPDVITQGGARLVEVGSTNRTRVADYQQAVGPHTAVLLKVHPSNFAMVGFTQSVSVEQVAQVAHQHGIPLLVDVGTGLLGGAQAAAAGEPRMKEVLAQGADLVMFSGDKLLGGPQAGVVAGRADLVAACRQHPLCRALRVDKITLAALEATLILHRAGHTHAIPVLDMLSADVGALTERAALLAQRLAEAGHVAHAQPCVSRPGGGTLPQVEVPSAALVLRPAASTQLARRLRQATVPIICRVEDNAVWLDLRCIPPSQDGVLLEGVVWALTEACMGQEDAEP